MVKLFENSLKFPVLKSILAVFLCELKHTQGLQIAVNFAEKLKAVPELALPGIVSYCWKQALKMQNWILQYQHSKKMKHPEKNSMELHEELAKEFGEKVKFGNFREISGVGDTFVEFDSRCLVC